MPDNEQRHLERLLLQFVDEAEIAGHPYPELVAIDRLMKILNPPEQP